MRTARWLIAALIGAAVAGCSVGDGLRVEGPRTAASTPANSRAPQIEGTPTASSGTGFEVPALRGVLLSDRKVEPDIQQVIRTCKVECVGRGVVTDLIGRGDLQQIATVSLSDAGVFAAFLIGPLDADPRVLWSVEGHDLKVSVGKDRTLLVESQVFGPTDRACCPTATKVGTYHWNGTRIVSVGERFIPGGG